MIAVAVYAYDQAAPPPGLLGVARYLSMALVLPLASTLADRYPRKWVMLVWMSSALCSCSWRLPSSPPTAPSWRCTGLRSRRRSSARASAPRRRHCSPGWRVMPASSRRPTSPPARSRASGSSSARRWRASARRRRHSDGLRRERGHLHLVRGVHRPATGAFGHAPQKRQMSADRFSATRARDFAPFSATATCDS